MIRIFLSVATMFFSVLALAESSVTPESISERIKVSGAESTVRDTFKNYDEWARIIKGISTGEPAWLSVAVQLHPALDGAEGEEIVNAVGEALENKPENVLSITAKVFDVTMICSGPDVDDARYNSYELSMAAISVRQKMVLSVASNSLRQLRDSCLAELEKSKTGIAHFYGKN